ncbi:MAG: hypothetical protein HYY88_04100, partial [candidate division NC10 bacterium]|nr:hypothetical protein [candidate division NC10 bacterium]
ILREDLAPAGPQRQLLDIILREASRLKLITGQFLDFAKPQPLLFRPCPLRPLLDETLHLLAKSSERHPEMTWVLTEEEPDLHVLADLDQLRQVVWNLCLNAMQAMSEGGTLTIALRPAPHGSQSVSSSIGQFGKGEAPKQSDQLTTRPMDLVNSEELVIRAEKTI